MEWSVNRRAAAEARLDELAEVEIRLDVTERVFEDYLAEIQRLEASRPDARILAEVEPALGSVEIDGEGNVVNVNLIDRTVLDSNLPLLGERIKNALQEARLKLAEVRKIELEDAARRFSI